MSPFSKGEERPIWSGRVISVAMGHFTAPDGEAFERELVHHPGAVAVVAVEDDVAVLVRQYRAPIDRELLEIPAGKRDVDGEPVEVTAERELVEEVGLRPGRLVPLARFYNSVGFSDELTHVFLALDPTPAPRDAQGHEERHLSIERVALAAVPDLVANGELADAKTIVGLLLAREHLGVR